MTDVPDIRNSSEEERRKYIKDMEKEEKSDSDHTKSLMGNKGKKNE